tara:strand:+ start:402 stop:1157 length:756 start_codon:yes stop_codon:yes gene_type:complete
MAIHLDRKGEHIALITLDNQPKRNAATRQDFADLGRIWDELAADDAIRAIAITGAGEKAFCAGADLSGDLTAGEEMSRLVHKGLQKYTVYRKPLIAAINGDCIAGGIELMLASDIRLAAPKARFGLTEVKFGVYPFGGATTKLQAQIGYVHAMELLMTGKLITAEEAARINLINRVVPAESLLDECLALAETIAGNSPAAVQAVKEQYSTSAYLRDIGKEPLEQTLGDRVRQSPDFKEGVAAFLEKRPPKY